MSNSLLEPVHADLWTDDLGLMLLIRHFERKLLELYDQGLVHGTTHTCLGQEYVPVALAPMLGPSDFVFSNHRGHGHYLALRRDAEGLLAEILGRQGGVCEGVGGSQHLLDGRFLSTGVQGQSLPVAVGTALHLARSEPGALALAFVGDGTWGQGAVYEALNMACLWRLPLVIVTEHNGIAQSTPTRLQMAGTIAGRAAAFGARYQRIDGHDIAAIRAVLGPAFDATRDGSGPLVVEFRTHRIGPHSKGDDTRSVEELREAEAHDWYREVCSELDEAARAHIDRVAAEVLARPSSVWRP